MRRAIALIYLWIGLGAHGCADDGDPPAPDPSPQNDAAFDAPQSDPQGCSRGGGQCGCAGSCQPGFKPAPSPLLFACPQPCDQCGACSMQCCVPESSEPDAAANDGGCTGSFSCLCGNAICVDGQWTCGPCT